MAEPLPSPASSASAITAGSALQRFGRGFRFPFAGIKYLAGRQDLWGWVAVPALINMVMLTIGIVSSWLVAPQLLSLVWTRPVEGLALVLWVVIARIMRIGLAAVVGMAVYLVAGVFSAPFNEVISERVEQEQLGDAGEPWGLAVFVRDTGISIVHSLLSIGLYAMVMVPLLVINLVPGLGSAFYLVASWSVTALFLAREMLDGVTSRRRMGLIAKFKLVRANLALCLGFGVATNVLLWIPLLNFVCMPMSVVGATLMYCELERAGLAPRRKALPPI